MRFQLLNLKIDASGKRGTHIAFEDPFISPTARSPQTNRPSGASDNNWNRFTYSNGARRIAIYKVRLGSSCQTIRICRWSLHPPHAGVIDFFCGPCGTHDRTARVSIVIVGILMSKKGREDPEIGAFAWH